MGSLFEEESLAGRIEFIKQSPLGQKLPQQFYDNLALVQDKKFTPDGASFSAWRDTPRVSLLRFCEDDYLHFKLLMNFLLYAYDLGVVYESDEVSNVISRLESKCSTEQLVRFQHEFWRKKVYDRVEMELRVNHILLAEARRKVARTLTELEAQQEDIEEDFVWSDKQCQELHSRR